MDTTGRSFNELIREERPVLVDFFAEWCGPCKSMKPILEQFKQRIGDRAVVLNVDVDQDPQAAETYQVQGVPTFAIFKQGRLVWRKAGVIGADQLEAALRPFL